MDTNDIPRAWRAALASIQTLAPDAVIAGGCLRDRDHGVKVKDIDIFVPCQSVDSHEGKVFEQKMNADGWQDVKTLHDESYNGSRISRSIETVFPNCPAINVIVMPYALAEFDFGICQIEFNGKRIHHTRDYVIDKGAKQFRVIPKMEDAEFVRTIERWSRLKEKFPGWKFNLGSRSQSTAVLPSGGPVHLPGVVSQSHAMTLSRAAMFKSRKPDMIRTINDLFGRGPGEYVVERAIAERLSRETTAQILGQHRGSSSAIVVKVDDKAVMPARRIIEDMLKARERFTRTSVSTPPLKDNDPA